MTNFNINLCYLFTNSFANIMQNATQISIFSYWDSLQLHVRVPRILLAVRHVTLQSFIKPPKVIARGL